jgi:hypothetical protein
MGILAYRYKQFKKLLSVSKKSRKTLAADSKGFQISDKTLGRRLVIKNQRKKSCSCKRVVALNNRIYNYCKRMIAKIVSSRTIFQFFIILMPTSATLDNRSTGEKMQKSYASI